jgi:hypothetical protein
VENFGMIYPSESGLTVCIAVEDNLEAMKCQQLSKGSSILEIFRKYWIYYPYWTYTGEETIHVETDPWNRSSTKSINLYLFTQAARRENSNASVGFDSKFRNLVIFPVSEDRMRFDGVEQLMPQVFTKWMGQQWLTCYKRKFMSFNFYWAPFQLELWIWFFITMSSVIGVSWIYTKFYLKDSTPMSFSSWLFVLGTIFEETSSAPTKLENKTFYRLSIGIWCLMVAILTNCYNSLMITGLNSPFPAAKIESFQDLLCDRSPFDAKPDFNLTSWMETSGVFSYWDQAVIKNNPLESPDCFRIWSPELVTYDTSAPKPNNALFFQLSYSLFMAYMREEYRPTRKHVHKCKFVQLKFCKMQYLSKLHLLHNKLTWH